MKTIKIKSVCLVDIYFAILGYLHAWGKLNKYFKGGRWSYNTPTKTFPTNSLRSAIILATKEFSTYKVIWELNKYICHHSITKICYIFEEALTIFQFYIKHPNDRFSIYLKFVAFLLKNNAFNGFVKNLLEDEEWKGKIELKDHQIEERMDPYSIIRFYVEKTFVKPKNLIFAGFYFDETIEGPQYWEDLARAWEDIMTHSVTQR